MSKDSLGISSRAKNMHIVVIGEKCDDIFVYGKVPRLNPEAPSPVFISEQKEEKVGMAANVYSNLRDMFIVADNDTEISLISQDVPITKTRYVEAQHNYILLRTDEEKNIDHIELSEDLLSIIQEADIVVISDYDKGFLNSKDLMTISKFAKCSFIDTKKPLGTWTQYFTWIKINMPEFKNPAHDYAFIAESKNIIITDGKNGAWLNGKQFCTTPTEIIDVSGAGDVFLAGLVFKWSITKDIERSIDFANILASYSVQKRGVVNNVASSIKNFTIL